MIELQRHRCRVLMRAWLVTAVALSASARLAPADQEKPTDALASKQQMVRDRVSQLVDRMYRLAEALDKTEPENAAKLRAALNETKERLIEINAERAVKQLRDGELDDATATQLKLLDDLNAVLQVVLAQPNNDEHRRDEMERLERQRQELNRLIEQQQQHVDATHNTAANAERAEAFGQAAEAVGKLLEQQQGLSEQTRSAGANNGAAPTEAQQSLSEEAKKEGDDVATLAEGGEEATFKAAKSASEALDAASKAMSEASRAMSGGDNKSAAQKQADAEEQLKRALHELKKEEERLKEKSDTAKLAEAQRQTQSDTQRLAQDMSGKNGESSQQGGDQRQDGQQQGGQQQGGQQQGGQQGGQQQDGQQQDQQQQPSPGTDRVQQAQQDMGEGAEDLEQDRTKEAEESQQHALDELQQARRELEQSLDQLRREEQLDTLANLQERLKTILTRQKRVNDATTELNLKPTQSWERADELRLAEIVEGQTTNLDETNQTLHILREDATTVAFPSVIEQVAADMDSIVERLTDRKLGALTQRIQGDIVETLEELLAAIEKQQSELQQEQQSGQQASSDQPPPLIPGSAELKLLKQSQLRVNRRTEVIEEVGQEDADAAAREARILSDRQKELSDLAREMQSRMSGETP